MARLAAQGEEEEDERDQHAPGEHGVSAAVKRQNINLPPRSSR